MEHGCQQVSQTIAEGEKKVAEQEKPETAAPQQADSNVNADYAAAGDDRPEEEGQCGGKPEQHVQNAAKSREPEPYPKHPKQVVEQAQRQAQQQSTGQGKGLGSDGYLHFANGAGGRRARPGRPVPHRRGSQWCHPPLNRRRQG